MARHIRLDDDGTYTEMDEEHGKGLTLHTVVAFIGIMLLLLGFGFTTTKRIYGIPMLIVGGFLIYKAWKM